jgi:hypothetical protein
MACVIQSQENMSIKKRFVDVQLRRLNDCCVFAFQAPANMSMKRLKVIALVMAAERL